MWGLCGPFFFGRSHRWRLDTEDAEWRASVFVKGEGGML